MSLSQSLRGTGRTTRMVSAALEAVRGGRRVFIVAGSLDSAARIFRHLHDAMSGEVLRYAIPHLRIEHLGGGLAQVVPADSDLIQWDLWRIRGEGSDTMLLADHFAIESRFARVLEELHRYDPPALEPGRPTLEQLHQAFPLVDFRPAKPYDVE